jgi:HPt (histidine-containing phosphotransfer) domain-containing protein
MQALDRSVLEDLRRIVGDETAVELIDLYFEESERLLSEMQRAVKTGDRKTAHLQAHTLKSTSATVGAKSLAVACADLEKVSAQSLDGAARLVQLVAERHSTARQALESYRATLD